MNAFTIKDLENLSGIKAHTIRIWEQRYTFLKPRRTDTNIRYYSNDELKTILNIALLNKYGYKISHINRMGPEEIRQRILSLNDTQAIQERIVTELVQEMVDLNMHCFEEILDRYISINGIERGVTQIIFPFLEKTGVLWLTGHINPAQEHLVSNVIRQKVIAAIETTNSHIQSEKTVMLFLPEGEHHELGLLFISYLLKSRGIRTVYLGANVPFNDAAYVLDLKKPETVFVHLTACIPSFNFDKFLNNIKEKFTNSQVIISGSAIASYSKKIPPNVFLKSSLKEVVDFIRGL